MHKGIHKELVSLIAIVKCHIDSLKEEVKRVQCYSFAGHFHDANAIHVGCHKQNPR